MSDIILTKEQLALVNTRGSGYFEACPGAGKTRAIVERYVLRPYVSPRKGVALLSYTNSASDEARRRCSGHHKLLQCPNFLGTIDSFINRFIVSPIYRQKFGAIPDFKESWEGLHGAAFKVRGISDVTFQLHWFSRDEAGSSQLVWSRIPVDKQGSVNRYKTLISRINTTADAVRQEFVTNGVLASEDVRWLMWEYLDQTFIGSQVAGLIGHRFAEVILDEGQDSDAGDVRFLKFLREAGVDVIVVGDPDQAIYGFRGGDIGAFLEFSNTISKGQRLNGNFRSAPAICSVGRSLRNGDDADVPCGPWRDCDLRVQVIGFNEKRLGESREKVLDTAQRFGLEAESITVLAYSGNSARKLAGASSKFGASANKVTLLAGAVTQMRDPMAHSRERRRALDRFVYVLRSLGDGDELRVSHDTFLSRIGLRERELREGCVRLMHTLPSLAVEPSEFKIAFQKGARSLGWDSWLKLSGLRAPAGNVWPEVSTSTTERPLSYSTIHGFKGLQSPAVALVIPQGSSDRPSGVDAWVGNLNEEPRRVLYVGATRAERLLMLVVDTRCMDQVTLCLNRDGVPFDLVR